MNKFVNVLVRMVRVLVRPLFPVKVYGEKNIENKKSGGGDEKIGN